MRLKKDQVAAIAQRLTQAVDQAGMSRAELANRLGISAPAVTHYLNGKRSCPTKIIEKVARITHTEPGWILLGDRKENRPKTPDKKTAQASSLSWGFREAPPDGGKDFGNAGVYATPATIRTVVREDGQNSLDAAVLREITIRFRLYELSTTSNRYKDFCRAMKLNELRKHIEAISEGGFDSKLGTKLSLGLESVTNDKLMLLVIDDYGTHGLTGDEFDSTSAFSALVRDNLNSRKEASTAGGIFGVGAKVNLACSRLSTVLFSSKVKGSEKRGTRLIGRTEMTYHRFEEGSAKAREYAGPGWLGSRSKNGVIESQWVPDDDPLLEQLLLSRQQVPTGVRAADATGSSIMIVAFTDPEVEAGASSQHVADQIVEAVAANFWPAIVKGALSVWVEAYVDDVPAPIKSEQVEPRTIIGLTELCEAWDKRSTGSTTPVLSEVGDVASISIPITIPATRTNAKGLRKHAEVQAECALVVRLADLDSAMSDPRVNHVAYVRGRAMVTRYQSRSNSVVGGRAFHAVLLAGELLGKTTEQLAAEQFLRVAEPPAHDRWTYTADLSEKYERGSKKALDEFHTRVTEELQRILRPVQSLNADGPEILKRLLQFQTPRISKSLQPQARINRSNARVEGGAWHVDAEVSLNPIAQPVRLEPRLSFMSEGSAPIPVIWSSLEITEGDAELDGNVLLLKPRAKRVSFRGVSDPISHPALATESSAILDLFALAGGKNG